MADFPEYNTIDPSEVLVGKPAKTSLMETLRQNEDFLKNKQEVLYWLNLGTGE